MPDRKAVAQGFIFCNRLIQSLDAVYHPIEFSSRLGIRLAKTRLIFFESIGIKAGIHAIEGKATAQGIIQKGKAAVGSIHHADDIEIIRHGEQFVFVKQTDFFVPLVCFDEHEEFPEDFAEVSTINFVDNEIVVIVAVITRFRTKFVERSRLQGKAVFSRAMSHDEVLVGIALVELYHHDPFFVLHAHK